jgi:hypothetical protein
MKSKLEIYALAVCFAAVVCLVISMGIAGYSILKIAVPKLTMEAYTYDIYQTNDTYWNSKSYCVEKEKVKVRPGEQELTKQRLDEFAVKINAEQREGLQALIQCLMFIIVSGIILLIHWKIAKKARGTSA